MKTPVFYNKNGTLTKYSFACGYIERKEKTGWKEMYMEHQHFHVRSGPKVGECYSLWETFEFDEMTKARKLYSSIKIK